MLNLWKVPVVQHVILLPEIHFLLLAVSISQTDRCALFGVYERLNQICGI